MCFPWVVSDMECYTLAASLPRRGPVYLPHTGFVEDGLDVEAL
jgi:hypothetical protein